LTGDTITADVLLSGYTAHKADGAVVNGTMLAGRPSEYSFYETLQDSSGNTIIDSSGNPVQYRTVYRKV